MHVLDANEIFWMTFYTYDRIMEAWGKNWPDAVALYIRLLKQSRIQETNQTWSLNEFLQNSLWRWREKLQTAKKILNGLWLIDYVQLKAEKGKFWTQLIRVNYLIDEQKVRTNSISYELLVDRLPAKPSADKTTTNTYIHNINAWNTQLKKESKKIPSVSELVEAYKNDEILPRKLDDENLVRERAEYKQAKKERAYKTTKWFLQQLNVCIDTVRFGWIRWDTQIRFTFALNQAMEREWKSMYWTEQTEQEYQSWKKTLALMNK